jgi:predicted DNA-binding protein (MmcQ/YjbR family)
MTKTELLGRLRTICLALPEVTQTVKWGNPTFEARGKIFAVLDRYGGRSCIAFRAAPARRAALLADGRFFAAPYDRERAWVCMHADIRLNWRQIGVLLRASHRLAFAASAGSPGRRAKTTAARRKSGA